MAWVLDALEGYGMGGCVLSLFLLVTWPAMACNCSATLSTCNEVASSDLVFIGTVESIAPRFLDAWNTSQSQELRTLDQETYRARTDPANGNVSALRDIYQKIFPDLPDETKELLTAANSPDALVKSFSAILRHGRLVRFKVKTVFRKVGDDDDDDNSGKGSSSAKAKANKSDDDDDKNEMTEVEVWTPFDDCGVDFQTGETYLVYAGSDEESNVISTDSCTRTRRVSDAGEDLAYLYFLKQNEKASSRMDGYVTTNAYYKTELDDAHEPKNVTGPVSNAIVELRWGEGVRYAVPDSNGRFVFDGLPKGQYTIAAYAPGFPRTVDLLAGPNRVRVAEKSCSREVLVIPKTPKP